MLRRTRGITVLGGADPELRKRHGVPTVAFSIEGRHAAELATALERDRVAIRWGHFYAYRAIEALDLHGRGGVVRASMAHYNTAADVERLVGSLQRAIGAAA
jgi:selenocysteine lyase/cysteine desulfurase